MQAFDDSKRIGFTSEWQLPVDGKSTTEPL